MENESHPPKSTSVPFLYQKSLSFPRPNICLCIYMCTCMYIYVYIYIHLNLILCCTPETNIILLVSLKKKKRKKAAWATQVALVVKNPPANAGDKRDAGMIPGSGRSTGGGHSNPLQCSCLENLHDRGA